MTLRTLGRRSPCIRNKPWILTKIRDDDRLGQV